jgi:Domain of unknown function (DUF5753)
MEGLAMTKMFDVRNSDAFRRLQDGEKTARSIFYNSPLFVPGLLQEPGYAQEMICGIAGLSPTDAEAVERVKVRNERHAAFLARLEGDNAPEVHAVLDESVLRRARVGSSTMRRQIEHLIELSHKPTIHIGVIPLDRGPHRGLAGSFEVHDTAGGSLVFFEGGSGDEIVDDENRIALYRDLASSLMGDASTGEDARTLMRKLIEG